MLVETDIPHPTCLYPGPREHFARGARRTSTEHTPTRVLQDNAAELYQLDLGVQGNGGAAHDRDVRRAERGCSTSSPRPGDSHSDLHANLGAIDPRLTSWADDWIFGQVWDDRAAFEDRALVAITALAATSKPDQLRNYLHGALQDGMDPRRIHEALMMLVVYVGFPTTLQALVVWQEVVASARRRGVEIDLPIK